jgi:cob(I)alamin adenosyltransferase
MAADQLGHAAEVAGDDQKLLSNEWAKLAEVDAAIVHGLQVGMLADPLADRQKLASDAGHQLFGVHSHFKVRLVAVSRRKKGLHELAGSGDDGSTGLLGGGRIAKDDLRIETYGTVDEASSALGLAKALSADTRVKALVEGLQEGLYRLGSELATSPDAEGRFVTTSAEDVSGLDRVMAELEAEAPMPDAFVLPGTTPASGALDLARAVVRRAERRCVSLVREGGISNLQVQRYLNRMGLLLFVLARYEEARAGSQARPAKQ